MDYLDELKGALYRGEVENAASLSKLALENGLTAKTILEDGLIMGMDKVGVEFRCGDLFIPEVLLAAQAMKASMEILRPHFAASGIEPIGRVVIGTVMEDIHDIGKNLVAMMLEGEGFDVHDLGVDVPPDKFVETARTIDPDLVCMSALLTTTMANMSATIQALRNGGLNQKVKIMVGGAPLTPQYAQEIGADGYAPDAGSAVMVAKDLMSKH